MRVFLGVLLAVFVAFGSARFATASCTVDADCDNGDTCSVPDQCVLGTCVLGGGGDLNGDLVCDAELDEITIRLTKLILRRKTFPTVDNSSVKGRCDMWTSGSPGGAFTGDQGVAIRVKDALSETPPPGDGIDSSVGFLPSECETTSGGQVRCKRADGHATLKVSPRSLASNQYKVSFKAKGIADLAGPFFGPVRVVISRGQRHSSDLIQDCKLSDSGMKCREF